MLSDQTFNFATLYVPIVLAVLFLSSAFFFALLSSSSMALVSETRVSFCLSLDLSVFDSMFKRSGSVQNRAKRKH